MSTAPHYIRVPANHAAYVFPIPQHVEVDEVDGWLARIGEQRAGEQAVVTADIQKLADDCQ